MIRYAKIHTNSNVNFNRKCAPPSKAFRIEGVSLHLQSFVNIKASVFHTTLSQTKFLPCFVNFD